TGVSAARAAPPDGGLAGLDEIYPKLDALYLDLHKNPELSMKEDKTAARLANELKALGYQVTTGVGGTGVVGVLKNGAGPTVLLRTELDALPIEEKTGVPYASTAKVVDRNGVTQPAMHACGHDIHMSGWTGAAALLARHKDLWHGTGVMIRQPGGGVVHGARAMIADGLFKRFPKPDFALAVHDSSDEPAGKVLIVPGFGMASVDSVDLTIFGRGGHRARRICAFRLARPRGRAPQDGGPGRPGSAHGPLAADPRLAREGSARAGRRHRRLDPRRHQAQHHPRRGQAPDHRADLQPGRPQADPRRHRAHRQGRGG